MIQDKIELWHYRRNLIEGATDMSQTSKLLEEFVELVAAQMPEETPIAIKNQVKHMVDHLYNTGRIKTVKTEDAQSAKLDAIGDMAVVQINIAVRNGVSLGHCMELAYDEIKDRKGKMVDGNFVKEE